MKGRKKFALKGVRNTYNQLLIQLKTGAHLHKKCVHSTPPAPLPIPHGKEYKEATRAFVIYFVQIYLVEHEHFEDHAGGAPRQSQKEARRAPLRHQSLGGLQRTAVGLFRHVSL